MNKIIVIIGCLISFLVKAKDILVIPYAYYAGQYYCLLLKAPNKKLVPIQDIAKKGESIVDRGAKCASLQTKALWGKYQLKDNHELYKRRPSKNDYYQSVTFFNEKLTEAVEKELILKTEKYVIFFVEVPYIQSDWVQKAPQLPDAIDSWYALHQLVWVKMQVLFEAKEDTWAVRKHLVGVNADIDSVLKDRLNQFGIYKYEPLSAIIKAQSSLIKVIERSAVRGRKHKAQKHLYSAYNSRLRRLRRSNR